MQSQVFGRGLEMCSGVFPSVPVGSGRSVSHPGHIGLGVCDAYAPCSERFASSAIDTPRAWATSSTVAQVGFAFPVSS